MLPSKWIIEKMTSRQQVDSINWTTQTDHTFQASCSFPSPTYSFLPYFEVFVTSIATGGVVAIGLGLSEIKGEAILPGWKKGSYGYHSDDGNAFVDSGNKQYGPTYTTGDVVGCGITLSNQLYFTKNGKDLGIVCTLNQGKYFALVGLDKASISTNFGTSPFMYDPILHLHGRAQIAASVQRSFASVINDVSLTRVLSFLENNTLLNVFGMVNKEYFRAVRQNQVWKSRVIQKWPTVTPASGDYPISSYYEFFKRRVQKLALSGKSNPVVIENCVEWEFKCPVALNKIQRTPLADMDFCSVCNKEVYLVRNMDELKEKVQKGNCVAIDFEGHETRSRQNPPRIFGRMKVVR